jgi:hypothetical protein
MSIGSIGKVGGLQPIAVTGSAPAPRGAFQQLAQLLEGGKLGAAQTAVATLKNFLSQPSPAASPAAATPTTAAGAAAVSGSGTLESDLQGLSQALKSGNVDSARAAFAKFAADAHVAGAFAHHRHGGGRIFTTDPTAATTVAGATTASIPGARGDWLTSAGTQASGAAATHGTRYRTLDVRA